jgi:hypothetical protein
VCNVRNASERAATAAIAHRIRMVVFSFTATRLLGSLQRGLND